MAEFWRFEVYSSGFQRLLAASLGFITCDRHHKPHLSTNLQFATSIRSRKPIDVVRRQVRPGHASKPEIRGQILSRPKPRLRLRLNSRPLSIDCKLAAFAQLIEVPSGLLSEAYATKHKRSRVLTSYALSKCIQAIKTTRVPTLAVRPQGLRAALPPDTPD